MVLCTHTSPSRILVQLLGDPVPKTLREQVHEGRSGRDGVRVPSLLVTELVRDFLAHSCVVRKKQKKGSGKSSSAGQRAASLRVRRSAFSHITSTKRTFPLLNSILSLLLFSLSFLSTPKPTTTLLIHLCSRSDSINGHHEKFSRSDHRDYSIGVEKDFVHHFFFGFRGGLCEEVDEKEAEVSNATGK